MALVPVQEVVEWLQRNAAASSANARTPKTAFGEFVFATEPLTRLVQQMQDLVARKYTPAVVAQATDATPERTAAERTLWVGVLADLLALSVAEPASLHIATKEDAHRFVLSSLFAERGERYFLACNTGGSNETSTAIIGGSMQDVAGVTHLSAPVARGVRGSLPAVRNGVSSAREPQGVDGLGTLAPALPNGLTKRVVAPLRMPAMGVDGVTYNMGLIAAESASALTQGRVVYVGRPHNIGS